MNIGIENFINFGNYYNVGTTSSDNGEFRAVLDFALSGNVLISPKIEKELLSNSDFAEEIAQKIRELGGGSGAVIVNRRGEVSRLCFSEKKEEHPTAEELKEAAKARARRKARLDAYFHLLEKNAIRRKLIEQENAKRFLNKKYRLNAAAVDLAARARQTSPPPLNPDYFF